MLDALLLAGALIATNDSFVASRIAAYEGKLPQCLSRFLDYPPSRGILGFPRCLFENPFKPNPDFWLKGVDFSCASPWNDSYGAQRAGTAISRRHIVYAKHFPLHKGVRIAFVGVTGEVSHYTIKGTKEIEECDIGIGLLDDELSPDVHPAKLLPADFEKFLVPGTRWPVVTFDQKERMFLSELHCDYFAKTKKMLMSNHYSEDAKWKPLSGEIVTGDSGNPAFLLYGDQPILLYCLLRAFAGNGPMLCRYLNEIQQAMDALCPGYKLETFDFASAGKAD